MTEPNDQGQGDQNQDQGAGAGASATDSGNNSNVDWEAQAKHFQGLADQRDAARIKAEEERDALKAAREAEDKKKLEEQGEYQKLAEQAQAKAEAAEKEKQQLALQVALQNHLAKEHPEYVADVTWIAPHVTDADSIASVVSEYVKAHPKQIGAGTASMGNRGQSGDGQITISKADLEDPAKIPELLKKYPDLDQKINSGEIVIT